MELYNNNSSYLQDFSKQDQRHALDKKKANTNKTTKPDTDRTEESEHNQDTPETENVGGEILSGEKDETASPDSIQSKKPDSTNGGMNFANRYK